MKRDLDLVRAILMRAEEMDETTLRGWKFTLDGHDNLVVAKHLELMEEHGLIEANLISHEAAGVTGGAIERITWDGYDYLDAVRDPSVWRAVQAKVAPLGGASFEIVKALASAYVQKQLGLGGD